MATAWLECWKCDQCDHKWANGGFYPSQCASTKCRSRRWDMVRVVPPEPVVPPKPIAGINTIVIAHAPGTKEKLASMLEAIMLKGSSTLEPNGLLAEIPICLKKWWEDGTQYECLMDAGHRELKHGMRGMVRTLDA